MARRIQFLAADFNLPMAGETRLLVLNAAELVPRPVGVLAALVPTQPHKLVDRGRRLVVPRHSRRVRRSGLHALLLLRFLRLHRLIYSIVEFVLTGIRRGRPPAGVTPVDKSGRFVNCQI